MIAAVNRMALLRGFSRRVDPAEAGARAAAPCCPHHPHRRREPVDIYASSATISGTPVGAPADSYQTWNANFDDVAGVEVVLAEELVPAMPELEEAVAR